jgi:hypothetical protein
MERKVTFSDKENNRIDLKCSIENGHFSISGNMGGSCGQILDDIKPKNREQKELITLWRVWHLNDMKAGTLKQEKALNTKAFQVFKGNTDYYKAACSYLKKKGLYKDGKYTYGTRWLTRKLSKDFEKHLNSLIDSIEKIESIEKLQKEKKDTSWEDVSNEISMYATILGKHLELNPAEALESITNEQYNSLTCQGIDYFVGTEDEANEEAVRYLTDDPYLWKESVAADKTKIGLYDWADEVISIGGIGFLNSWDGNYSTTEFNGTQYIIFRR